MAFILLLLAVYIRTGTNVYPCPFPLFRSSPMHECMHHIYIQLCSMHAWALPNMLKNVDPVILSGRTCSHHFPWIQFIYSLNIHTILIRQLLRYFCYPLNK